MFKSEVNAPIYLSRFFTGLYTFRSPLTPPFIGGERQDAAIDGLNMELQDDLLWRRRPGFSKYKTYQLGAGEIPRQFFSWRLSNASIKVVADLTNHVSLLGTSGTTTYDTITGSGVSFLSIQDTLYYADGVIQRKKRDSAGASEKWGITLADRESSTNAGPNLPGTVTDSGAGSVNNDAGPLSAGSSAGSDARWANPDNILGAADNNAATYFKSEALGSTALSGFLTATNFGFSIPIGATINGVTVSVRVMNSLGVYSTDSDAYLLKAGVQSGTNHATNSTISSSFSSFVYGNASDLWGTTLTVADVNDSGFGAEFQTFEVNNGEDSTDSVDSITITVNYTTASTASWTNPNNIKADDAANATATVTTTASSELVSTNFGFSIPPGAHIAGVEIKIEVGSITNPVNLLPILLISGVASGSRKTLSVSTTGDKTFGSLSDTWGLTLVGSDANTVTFGVSFYAQTSSGSTALGIDKVNIKIYYSTEPSLAYVGGSLSPVAGYLYRYSFVNSHSGHVSTASDPTASTGAQSAKQVNVTGPRSTDTQVDTVRVYRTKDGGSIFYRLGEVANPGSSTWTYNDNKADSLLDVDELAPENENDPPPTGLTGVSFHLGRVWGVVDNLLYGGSGPDVTVGVPEEGFDPSLSWTFPEELIATASTQNGLLVFGRDNIYIMRGVDPTSFTPVVLLQGIGIANANAYELDGERLYVFTNTRQLLAIDTNVINIGLPVSTIIGAFDPALVYITMHSAGDNDSALYVSDGSTQYMRYSTLLKSWSPKAVVTGGFKAMQSIEVSAGTHKLLIGDTTALGYILQRDTTVWSDNLTAYLANVTFGGIRVAPPTQVALITSIILETAAVGSQPTLSILANEVSGSFISLDTPLEEPPEIGARSSYNSKRYSIANATTAVNGWMQVAQLKIAFTNEAVNSTIYGIGLHRKEIKSTF